MILIAVTAYLNWTTLATLWTARSEVPWRDQWTYLDDAKSILEGHDVFHRLWYCYWGHRLLITRLITALDVRFFSGLNTPVVALSLMLQIAQAILLSWVAWRLFRDVSVWVFALTVTLIFHLVLSPLQLENLIWGGQVGFVVAAAAATAAFFFLALLAEQGDAVRRLKSRALLRNTRKTECGAKLFLTPLVVRAAPFALLTGCLAAGMVSTLSSANGVLVWVVLFLQASVLRLPRSVRTLLASMACFVFAFYFWGYEAGPQLGMGVKRAVLHPLQSLPLVGMLAVGPISVFSLPLGKFCGCTALIFSLYAGIKAFRTAHRPPALLSLYGAVAMFSFATIVTMVTNRISPEFVASRPRWLLLPSRYFTAPFFFWASMFGISVWILIKNRQTWLQFLVIGSVTLGLTLGTCLWQLRSANDWRSYYRELDVAATALILDVHDPDNPALERIYPDVALRSSIRDWLQSNGLSIFHGRRARRLGFPIPSDQSERGRCRGAWEFTARVNDGTFRATGWIWDVQDDRPPRDLVFADANGVAIGLARSGLRHSDLAGRAAQDAGWQGYLSKPSTGHVTVYGVLPEEGRYCHVAEMPLHP